MIARFRIIPDRLTEMLLCLEDAGIKPLRVYERTDGEIAVEVGELTEEQGKALATNFKPEWSAIVGIVRSPLFETKQ